MDLDKYLNKYNNVSIDELKKISETFCYRLTESMFEFMIRHLHNDREEEKKNGKRALRTRPLVHVLSVSVQPKNENKDIPLDIYGRIHAEICDSGEMVVHELYRRDSNVAETLGTSNTLTLSGPDFSYWPRQVGCTPLSCIDVSLFDGDDKVFAKECFWLDDTEIEGDYEEVKRKVIHCEQGSLTVHYIVIPFGVHGRIEVDICNRRSKQPSEKLDFVNVNGKITIHYANTYGNYVGEECVLFEKQGGDFERVEINHGKHLQLSRCWVALPAYSSLVVCLDLSEFETRRKIANNTIELVLGSGSCDYIVQDDILIRVQVEWFPPQPFGRSSRSPRLLGIPTEEMDTNREIPTEEIEEMDTNREIPTEEIEEMDTNREIPTEEIEEMDSDGEDESSSDYESDDALSSKANPSWGLRLRHHKNNLWPSPAVEIFSVFIGREKSKAVQIYGSIEVLCDDDGMCYIFKRDERDALGLSEHLNSTPIPDGSRLFEDFRPLGMKVDIKDVEGRLAIKGYVDWSAEVLDSCSFHEKQLCSFIQGQNGFAAVHYSIFSDAVGANIKVYLNLKPGFGDVYPKVCGSLITQYNCYDYASRYSKDYYRIVLFKRTRDDSVQPSSDWSIPLSRSMIVVPSYSSLIFNVDLSFGEKMSCAREIEVEISEGSKTIETADCFLRIELDWCEIK